MSYETRTATDEEVKHHSTRDESQFFDRKSRSIKPAKVAQSFSSLANADGGELLIGVEDDGTWMPFESIESTNDITSLAARVMRQEFYTVEYIKPSSKDGVAIMFYIDRHPNVVYTEADLAYQRIGAQNHQVVGERLEALKRSKGDSNYEATKTDATLEELENSTTMLTFMLEGTVFTEPSDFLKKNRLVVNDCGIVAGTLVFSDLPQAYLPNSGVKLYRYKTSGQEDRDHLDGLPETIEGPVTALIETTKRRVEEIVATIPRLDSSGFTTVEYPSKALHEILVNAFLHRDYGMRDYVHVRIFDNRIEIDSPGRLHGHVTVQNILDERSARNPLIQRIVNKFPEPPNMDIGEGLNTAFKAMEQLLLSYPVIEELSDRVRVTISHEPLASPAQAIMEAAKRKGSINNTEARQVTKIDQERTIRRLFEDLVDAGQLSRTGSGRGTRYFPISD
ncbi:ATP-dependent DNA helicase RecG [Arthrobacter sp. SLBN-83]|uniref:ATP-binding protein n=1 Tax=Arthrobacter sp. SLBN-83 TaxID=2768449 RepID=UPI0011509886|nr:ATP-binding protein [Arthrobacter sp. SLBN-83]TQJ59273.1 ATP-dependent DNA helicase RecG [Arthrobacter sp. SLBN-83]